MRKKTVPAESTAIALPNVPPWWRAIRTAPAVVAVVLATGGCRTPIPASPGADGARQPPRRVYSCRHIKEDAIRIDGLTDERAWRRAARMESFVTAGPDPKSAQYATTARLLWSDTHLYVSFFCRTDAVRVAGSQRDAPIWDGDAAELFLVPIAPEEPYFEINVNPGNVIYDARIENWRYEYMVKHWQEWAQGFNGDIESAVRVHEANGAVTGWSCEWSIPFADMVHEGSEPTAGSEWFFDAFRAAQTEAGTIEFSAWEPTYKDFHRPHLFPVLRFVE